MKKVSAIILIVCLFVGCGQKDDNSQAILNENEERIICGNDLEQQGLANNTCLVCHTDLGIDDVLTTRIDLFKRGTARLKKDIYRLKESKDPQHAQLLDTLTTSEINCVVDYLMKFKETQQ
ncbi:hypothetical protein [Adhaeribacter soli]|uniref:Cytochrome c domain-containing protein n=1 Tax=Adhaeribacter soli TaxID=2607655 RepID=A0A5N1ISA1_9BACT|nr:hypothetical protein [Adhaeribacter soli]KAA9331226.1 hypothetical protein F0P94_15175 [Adhaeribacter soli]